VEKALSQELPALVPTARRIPDRSLLLGLDGTPATDEQVEKGEFTITARIAGEDWWVVLDMEPADIVIREQ
jgi:hypothetical protein